jgi:voltage-gated potassium channel
MIALPASRQRPLRALGVRMLAALALIGFIFIVVYLDRDGYRDNNRDELSLLDSVTTRWPTATESG